MLTVKEPKKKKYKVIYNVYNIDKYTVYDHLFKRGLTAFAYGSKTKARAG